MNTLPSHVYAIGIAGVGVSAIARYFLVCGIKVSGSDPRPSPLVDDLRALGAEIFLTQDGTKLQPGMTVVYSDDVAETNPDRQAADRLGLPSMSFAQALGLVMGTKSERIAVAGTNGKSTTSAMLGILLAKAQLDPTVFVGSRVSEFAGNFRLGSGPLFVAEADEYRDHFLHLEPTAVLVTNVELDHVEYFQTVDRMEKSYQTFVDRLEQPSRLVFNADDPASLRLWGDKKGAVSFGFAPTATVRIVKCQSLAGRETFELVDCGASVGQFEIHVPGRMNVMNAVGAMVMANRLGVSWDLLRPLIAEFKGIWRRFEVLNPGADKIIVNDYAHHPTSVQATIEGARAFYPERRVIAVFQPHHRHRLHALFADFSAAFDAAHHVLITDVYAVPGREAEEPDQPTSADLAAAIRARHVDAQHTPSLTDVVNTVTAMVQPGDVVLLMGAGDIWTIGQSLADAYAA